MSAGDYQREIAEIDAMLEMHRVLETQHGPDPSALLMYRGLAERRSALLAEMEGRGDARMPGQELDVTLSGPPVVGNTVPIAILGDLLTNLQRTVALGVGNLIGHAGRMTRIPPAAVLRAGPATPGSYRLHIEAGELEPSIFTETESPLSQAVESFLVLIDTRATEEQLLAAASTLGVDAVDRGRDLLKRIAISGVNMEVSWPTVSGTRRSSIAPKAARQRHGILQRLKVTTRTRTARGRLDGAVFRRGYFEFVVDDGEVLTGSVNPTITADVERHINKECQALFHVTESHNQVTGRNSQKYRLDRVVGLDEPMFEDGIAPFGQGTLDDDDPG